MKSFMLNRLVAFDGSWRAHLAEFKLKNPGKTPYFSTAWPTLVHYPGDYVGVNYV